MWTVTLVDKTIAFSQEHFKRVKFYIYGPNDKGYPTPRSPPTGPGM